MRGGWKEGRAGFAPADGRRLAAWLTPYPVPGANLSPREALDRRGRPREGRPGQGRRPQLGRARGPRRGPSRSPLPRAGRPRRRGRSDNGPGRVGTASRARASRRASGRGVGRPAAAGAAPGAAGARRLRVHPEAHRSSRGPGGCLIGQNRANLRILQVPVLFCF